MMNDWAIKSARELIKKIEFVLSKKRECNIVLTGGNSAHKLYCQFASESNFYNIKGLNFYFSDERCVDISHPDSNCKMAIDALFSSGVPNGWSIYPINGDAKNREEEASRYSNLVPDQLDILLLGVGADGHVASIFPGSKLLQDGRPTVECVSPSNSNLYDRFTFTPQLIARAKIIYLLASTESKRAMILRCQKSNDLQLRSMPVSLLLGGVGGFEERGEVKIL